MKPSVGMFFTHKDRPGKFKVTSIALGEVYYRAVESVDSDGQATLGYFNTIPVEDFSSIFKRKA